MPLMSVTFLHNIYIGFVCHFCLNILFRDSKGNNNMVVNLFTGLSLPQQELLVPSKQMLEKPRSNQVKSFKYKKMFSKLKKCLEVHFQFFILIIYLAISFSACSLFFYQLFTSCKN